MGSARLQDSSFGRTELDIIPIPSAGPFTAERFRVGMPALQLLPLVAAEPHAYPATVAKFAEVQPRIYEILSRWGIESEDEPELVQRSIPENDLTVLVAAVWKEDNKAQAWYNAAYQIRSLLYSHRATRNVKVELLSWQLTKLRNIDIVEAEYPLVAAWEESIHPKMHAILKQHPKVDDGWHSIDTLRCSYVAEEFEARFPNPVTISFTMDFDLDPCDWIAAQRQINAMSDAEGFPDVEVHFERGDCPTWTDLIGLNVGEDTLVLRLRFGIFKS